MFRSLSIPPIFCTRRDYTSREFQASAQLNCFIQRRTCIDSSVFAKTSFGNCAPRWHSLLKHLLKDPNCERKHEPFRRIVAPNKKHDAIPKKQGFDVDWVIRVYFVAGFIDCHLGFSDQRYDLGNVLAISCHVPIPEDVEIDYEAFKNWRRSSHNEDWFVSNGR